MIIKEKVKSEIHQMINHIKKNQSDDGSWKYCFESGPMTDAYMIIILRVLEYKEEDLIKALVNRLLNTQQSNGAWRLYDDESGNLSATVEAYTALLFSGYADGSDNNMKKAESFILKKGGLENTHVSTKFMLALNDLYPWPYFFPFPLFMMNKIHSYKLSSYVKAHLAPILILGHHKPSFRNQWTPDLSHLFSISKKRKRKSKRIYSISKFLAKPAIKKAESYMLKGIEADGTLFSYASATFFMIYAFLALGYDSHSRHLQNAVAGLKSLLFKIDEDCHIQNSSSTIWDTALFSYALQEAGLSIDDPAILSSAKYLLSFQKDYRTEGGWGFSENNSSLPDIDDTQAALRAISRFTLDHNEYRKAWNAGVKWLLDMQNDDGGWGSFDKNTHQSIITLLPIENLKDTFIDPSTADLTGRTLEFFGNYLRLTIRHPRIESGVRWLIENQKDDGSWYGRWGVSYIYGTWAAVTGLKAVGVPSHHPAIQKAAEWIKNIQRSDGGWGESCKSDQKRTFVPLTYSTIVQTSWAVDTLISIYEKPTTEIEKGIDYILNRENHPEKSLTYPMGAGLPGHFYIYYHSYPHIWPLLALSHYIDKIREF
ncbi:prenyltransferase/squalene oxidase repeat-containing protein [Scopulibacillus cellulosilyticus]|uniref:Prenyltransferase/squalene oxidase repeat-containing protein n=1 Tax=Scopulibacillus cellulosilyticus TaxID=2665665 RepID=A0ABW2Q080_9BACL